MRPKLFTLDQAHAILAATEPLGAVPFDLGENVRFDVDRGWQHGLDARAGSDVIGARLVVGPEGASREYPLTKEALLHATSICGLGRSYAARCPADLTAQSLNYWFRDGLLSRQVPHSYQLLTVAGAGAAIIKPGVTPFSAVNLLSRTVDAIHTRYGAGTEVLVDYKFHHSLKKTHLRLVVPETMKVITGTGVDDDIWSVGVQLRTSITGEDRTSLDGYLFRWWCTNGATDVRASSGVYSRRAGTAPEEVYDWTGAAVADILDAVEPGLDRVQEMTGHRVDRASNVLREIFDLYRVPVADRAAIIEAVSGIDPLTMYDIMAAITEAANNPELDPSRVDVLLRTGGDLPHAATRFCDECYRILD